MHVGTCVYVSMHVCMPTQAMLSPALSPLLFLHAVVPFIHFQCWPPLGPIDSMGIAPPTLFRLGRKLSHNFVILEKKEITLSPFETKPMITF